MLATSMQSTLAMKETLLLEGDSDSRNCKIAHIM